MQEGWTDHTNALSLTNGRVVSIPPVVKCSCDRKDRSDAVLQPFLSIIVISLATGGLLIGIRRVLKLPRRLHVDLGLTLLGAGILVVLHFISPDLFGLDPWYGLWVEVAKHGLELLVIMMMLVAF